MSFAVSFQAFGGNWTFAATNYLGQQVNGSSAGTPGDALTETGMFNSSLAFGTPYTATIIVTTACGSAAATATYAGTAPTILSAAGAGVVGAPLVSLAISYSDPDCDVVSGLWEGSAGSGQSATLSLGQPTACGNSITNAGASLAQPCQAAGQSTDYVTLTDSQGNKSQRFAYTFTCYPADPSTCTGTLVADVTYQVANSVVYEYDPYPTPRYWGNTNSETVHRQFWQTGSSSFCELITFDPVTFTTVSGKSPNGSGSVSSGLTGHATEQERILFSATGILAQAPSGDLGTFDTNCTISSDRLSYSCTGSVPPSVTQFLSQPTALVVQESETEQADNGTSMMCTEDTTQAVVVSCTGDITG